MLANSFNTFLASLTADFVPMPQIIPGSFFPVPEHLLVDTHMVYEALRGIKSNKSGGPDPIPGKVWKECAFELSPVITDIYNASMVQGYVPVFLKQSEVVPVLKCSPPNIAKVMEGLTLDSLFKQVCDKLITHQFALARKSTTHALVYFLQVILEALDQGDTYARLFFTDFSKGFDLVDHNIVIQEMELLGVHEATIRWIGSFLTDRSQRVRISQVYPHPVTPNGAIPQGTKLTPLLFTILVNNLCRDWRYRIKYIDDTSVFESIPQCLPSYLLFIADNINTYASMHNMQLSGKKRKDMVINFFKYQPTV